MIFEQLPEVQREQPIMKQKNPYSQILSVFHEYQQKSLFSNQQKPASYRQQQTRSVHEQEYCNKEYQIEIINPATGYSIEFQAFGDECVDKIETELLLDSDIDIQDYDVFYKDNYINMEQNSEFQSLFKENSQENKYQIVIEQNNNFQRESNQNGQNLLQLQRKP